MAERQEFGPHLRAARLRRGITIAQIARDTKVTADLWEGLERSDLSRWPSGLYARAYVRAYAVQVGLDPEATVDEFCRCFPAGDRRAGRVVKEQAALLGHENLRWEDDIAHLEADRRAAPTETERLPTVLKKGGRLLAAIGDASTVLIVSTVVSVLFPIHWAPAAAACAFVYHGGSLLLLGGTPAAWAIDTYVSSRHPSGRAAGAPRFRLVRGSERAKA
jgi:hypothetical protein